MMQVHQYAGHGLHSFALRGICDACGKAKEQSGRQDAYRITHGDPPGQSAQ
jgi:hypothetical protein